MNKYQILLKYLIINLFLVQQLITLKLNTNKIKLLKKQYLYKEKLKYLKLLHFYSQLKIEKILFLFQLKILNLLNQKKELYCIQELKQLKEMKRIIDFIQ